ncbi:hypothetical protein [Actinomadura sediminis]|uniref:Uncharacterized protein n=1 Tax=Actinomadura sediminis TaxID=1038904 RepID=A0ABW3ESA1_9ACTN
MAACVRELRVVPVMYRLVSALLVVGDYLLLRTVACTPRVCDGCGRTWRRLTPTQCTQIGARRLPACRRWTCSGRLHPVWEPTTDQERFLRDVLAAEAECLTEENGAPGWTPGTPPTATDCRGVDAMTIISRRARDLHAGDVITHDPDHDRPVRWRVSRPPVAAGGGEYALAHYWDLDSGSEGILYFKALRELPVEPVGGAA